MNEGVRKKIMYVVTKSNWGGAQRYVFDLATNLPKNRFETVVACGGSGMLIEKLEKAGVRVIKIPHLERDINIKKELLSLFSLWRIIREEKPDVIHLNSSKIGGLGAITARIYNFFLTPNPLYQMKIIFTAHGWAFKENRFFLNKFIIWLLSWLTAALSHFVIIISRNDLASTVGFPFLKKEKFLLIPIGIEPEKISFLTRENAENELGINPNKYSTLIGCITEFTQNKGVKYLIKTMKKLPTNIHLGLIGDGEEKNEMKKLAEIISVSEKIYFFGFKKDAYKYLKAFDIFAFPSIKEGLPYTLLEAGLAELPIIATNIGGIPDIVDNKKNGILVEPKNPYALTEEIKKLLENKEGRDRFGIKLAEKIKTEFSFNKMLEDTIKIYL